MLESLARWVKRVVNGLFKLFRKSWEEMGDRSKGLVLVTILLHAGGIALGGVMGEAAFFSLVSLLTLGTLIGYWPRACAWCIRNMAVSDLIATSAVIWFGITSGTATIAASMTFLGLAVSALLRLAAPMEPVLRTMPNQLTWDPFQWVKGLWNGKEDERVAAPALVA